MIGRRRSRRRAPTAVALAAGLFLAAAGAGATGRRVAVTFDDLPAATSGSVSNDPGPLRAQTRKLLDAVRAHGAPAVGFVNEGKLFVEGESAAGAEARTALLDLWLDAGFELGNHSYSHHSLNQRPLEEFEADVLRGELVTRRLMAARRRPLRYFRHPFLQVGLDLAKRRSFETFLHEHGYTVAPVTIDSDEYVFAAVYADALRRGDRTQADRVAAEYLRYMAGVVVFVEGVSQRLLGREIPQVLLLHANSLNADRFPDLAALFTSRGYRFVTLEEALRDPAYALPDDYVGAWGISWLHHWELAAGRKRSPSPDPAAWISRAYAALPR